METDMLMMPVRIGDMDEEATPHSLVYDDRQDDRPSHSASMCDSLIAKDNDVSKASSVYILCFRRDLLLLRYKCIPAGVVSASRSNTPAHNLNTVLANVSLIPVSSLLVIEGAANLHVRLSSSISAFYVSEDSMEYMYGYKNWTRPRQAWIRIGHLAILFMH